MKQEYRLVLEIPWRQEAAVGHHYVLLVTTSKTIRVPGTTNSKANMKNGERLVIRAASRYLLLRRSR